MAYKIDGRLLEICSCETICPCFVNQTPDKGACDVTVAWHIDNGEIEGVDVTGRTVAGNTVHFRGVAADGRRPTGSTEVESPTMEEAYIAFMVGRGRGGLIHDGEAEADDDAGDDEPGAVS